MDVTIRITQELLMLGRERDPLLFWDIYKLWVGVFQRGGDLSNSGSSSVDTDGA
jgi:hypothetical protein